MASSFLFGVMLMLLARLGLNHAQAYAAHGIRGLQALRPAARPSERRRRVACRHMGIGVVDPIGGATPVLVDSFSVRASSRGLALLRAVVARRSRWRAVTPRGGAAPGCAWRLRWSTRRADGADAHRSRPDRPLSSAAGADEARALDETTHGAHGTTSRSATAIMAPVLRAREGAVARALGAGGAAARCVTRSISDAWREASKASSPWAMHAFVAPTPDVDGASGADAPRPFEIDIEGARGPGSRPATTCRSRRAFAGRTPRSSRFDTNDIDEGSFAAFGAVRHRLVEAVARRWRSSSSARRSSRSPTTKSPPGVKEDGECVAPKSRPFPGRIARPSSSSQSTAQARSSSAKCSRSRLLGHRARGNAVAETEICTTIGCSFTR